MPPYAPRMSSAPGPRVGIWGRFDVAEYGNLLLPRIFEHELLRRLPAARVYPYAPLGGEHPIGMDGGSPATPLGSWTPARIAQLAEQLDLVAVAGDVIHIRDDVHREGYPNVESELKPSRFFVEGLGADVERSRPVVWHAVGVPFELDAEAAKRVRDALASKRYVSARGPTSRERLLATGTEQEIALVPDPAVLVSRLFSAEIVRRRLEYLRAIGSYPAEDSPLLIQGDAALAEAVPHDVPIVLDAPAAHLSRPVHRLPEHVTLEDLVAAIAGARAFVGSSPQGYVSALAYGVPAVLVSQYAPSSIDGFGQWAQEQNVVTTAELPDAIGALLRGDVAAPAVDLLADAVDAHFDTLAEIAERSWSEALPDEAAAELARALAEAERRHDALLRAYAARGEALLREQLRRAEMLDAMEADKSADATFQALLELAETRNRFEILEAELARVSAERDALRRNLAGNP